MTIGVDRATARAEAAAAGRQALELAARLLWGAGWLVAKALGLVLAAIGGFFWSLGWLGRRAAWPALKWIAAAVAVGWEDGRKPGEGRRR